MWDEGREKREETVHMDYQQPSWAGGEGRSKVEDGTGG